MTGFPIEWDDSLEDTIVQGPKLVVNWINKLQKGKVHLEDICILVWDERVQRELRDEIDRIGGRSQTGDDLIKMSRNSAVVETISHFKGLESKVVILFDPAVCDDARVQESARPSRRSEKMCCVFVAILMVCEPLVNLWNLVQSLRSSLSCKKLTSAA